MKGYRTTFVGLFDPPGDRRPAITEIEIPIIQRDYAQGRPDDATTEIRQRFLDALVRAATTDAEMGLDFVYGYVKGGVLSPLDGQQRLTTLFLLHWYVASLARTLDPTATWLRFSYATRPTSRDFCRTIAEHPYPDTSAPPSEWITDQPWFVYPWRLDPTISSMLTMLDAIHARFDREPPDFGAVWARLDSRKKRAIWFLFLPVADMDYGEDLYIKMNSRGKPLTPFEVFKADLEEALAGVLTNERHEHLRSSIDGTWTDLLWEYERAGGGDFVIDEEFRRYFSFIIDVCEWRDGEPLRRWHDETESREWPLEERARLAFADPQNNHSARNRDFFLHAFDTWVGVSPAAEFSQLFTAGGAGDGPLALLVSTDPDLFGACIAKYGSEREFSLAETLMLFAVLIARQRDEPLGEDDLNRRLRSLRNLVESAFLERRRMTEYVRTVEDLILRPRLTALDAVKGFNQEWTSDEKLKWQLMDQHPGVSGALHQLEDHSVLRGRLLAFELDAQTIVRRASAFASVGDLQLRDAFGAALLTKGDYSRDVGWQGQRRQLGSSASDESWRDLFTAGTRASAERTRVPLMLLLDDVSNRMATGDVEPPAALEAICAEWLGERQARRYFDWRYYLVRYSGARSSTGAGYYHDPDYDEHRGGFSYGRLRILHGANYTGYFSDALLRAAWTEGNLEGLVEKPSWWHRTDPGMRMTRSAVEIRCTNRTLELVLPADDAATEALALGALRPFPRVKGHRIIVNQKQRDGVPVDGEDRVQLCIRLVRALHDAGL